jgi:hypothetical protein
MRFFSSPKRKDRLGGPPTVYAMKTGGFFLRIKQPGHEEEFLLPSDTEVKNGGAIPPVRHLSSWRSD